MNKIRPSTLSHSLSLPRTHTRLIPRTLSISSFRRHTHTTFKSLIISSIHPLFHNTDAFSVTDSCLNKISSHTHRFPHTLHAITHSHLFQTFIYDSFSSLLTQISSMFSLSSDVSPLPLSEIIQDQQVTSHTRAHTLFLLSYTSAVFWQILLLFHFLSLPLSFLSLAHYFPFALSISSSL